MDPADLRTLRGIRLREARDGVGLSGADVVERVNERFPKAGLTLSALYSYEKGRVLLPRTVGEHLAEVLNVPIGQLLVGDPDFPSNRSRGNEAGLGQMLEGLPGYEAGWTAAAVAELVESAHLIKTHIEASESLLRSVLHPPIANWDFLHHLIHNLDMLSRTKAAARVMRYASHPHLEELGSMFKGASLSCRSLWKNVLSTLQSENQPSSTELLGLYADFADELRIIREDIEEKFGRFEPNQNQSPMPSRLKGLHAQQPMGQG